MQEASPRTRKLPAHCGEVALVLQGGGALGAYQAGVYEALAARGYEPQWVAGMSIGAVNAAIVAGNPPEQRLARLEAFWERITDGIRVAPLMGGDLVRGMFNDLSALASMTRGVPGFFEPRVPPPWLMPPGAEGATSFYDTAPLRQTLSELVDLDYLNSGAVRLTVGAANVRTGNAVFFDTVKLREWGEAMRLEHILASTALPPGFPSVEIDGEHYWDGGVVSNTPLQFLLDQRRESSTLVFQVDLFSSRGQVPRALLDVYERHKDILYSSRTRLNTDAFAEAQDLRRAVLRLIERLPASLKQDPEVELIRTLASDASMSIVQLIYREKNYESQSKDYEFSRASMQEHWQAGIDDTRRTLRREQAWLAPPGEFEGVRTFDMTRDFD